MKPNPYASPGAAVSPPADLVDRAQRDALAATLRDFLDGEFGSLGFDDRLDESYESPDSAVRFVAGALWHCYDDCRDHLAALNKPEWGYTQRLLLLLESDSAIEQTKLRRWSWTQIVALAAVAGFLVCSTRAGFGRHLIPVAIPLGIVSIAISYVRRKNVAVGPYDPILYPFATFADLRQVYESVAAFKKKSYPPQMATRQIRPPVLAALIQVQFYAAWLLFSPLVLFVQMFPQAEVHVRVVVR
jgi:hypothetical protein